MMYEKPIAKWQRLLSKYYEFPELLRMTYKGASDHLAQNGYRLVFANTVRGPKDGMMYVAIIEGPDDWVAFVTEAAGEWRRDVKRFTLQMTGREQIEGVLRLGGWRDGLKVSQQDARLLAQAALFTRTQGKLEGDRT